MQRKEIGGPTSGIIGHTMHAILGAKAVERQRLSIAPLMQRHWASYLAGAHLGCDIQTMPEAICVDTGREVGYGTLPLEQIPLTGGKLRPCRFVLGGKQYRPEEIHQVLYGRSHLAFGWPRSQLDLTLPWDHLPDYGAAVVEDAVTPFGPGEQPLAYALGWMTHLAGAVSSSLLHPG